MLMMTMSNVLWAPSKRGEGADYSKGPARSLALLRPSCERGAGTKSWELSKLDPAHMSSCSSDPIPSWPTR